MADQIYTQGSTAPLHSEIPHTLANGRYILGATLGQGGAAVVCRAIDTQFQAERAVKILLHSEGAANLQTRLQEEARIMARLQHDHILQIIDQGEDQGFCYLVMELADGSVQGTLDRDGPMSTADAVLASLHLLSALAFAHRQQIIHRDVKPHNLLIVRGRIRLADFGIARQQDSTLTRSSVAMGSMAYMPPEQRIDARHVSPASDLYAAGATLYAMLTAGNPIDLFTAEPRSPRWYGIDTPVARVIQRATAFKPEDRYPDAAGMAGDLRLAAEQMRLRIPEHLSCMPAPWAVPESPRATRSAESTPPITTMRHLGVTDPTPAPAPISPPDRETRQLAPARAEIMAFFAAAIAVIVLFVVWSWLAPATPAQTPAQPPAATPAQPPAPVPG